MEFQEMIDTAAKKCGTVRALAEAIGMRDSNISAAKRSSRGIPDEACARLAEILGMTYGEVSAARNFATAKDQKQRDFWFPFVREIPRKAAAWMIGIATAATMATVPIDAQANDIFDMSTTPLQPTPILNVHRNQCALC